MTPDEASDVLYKIQELQKSFQLLKAKALGVLMDEAEKYELLRKEPYLRIVKDGHNNRSGRVGIVDARKKAGL